MTTKAIQAGDVMHVTAGAAKSANDVEEFAGGIGVWQDDTASGDVGAVGMVGVYELDKETGVAFTAGDSLYWDATNDRLDKTTTNTPAGMCWEDAASGATSAKVKINFGATQA